MRGTGLLAIAVMLTLGAGAALAQEQRPPSRRCLITGHICPGCTADMFLQLQKGTTCNVELSSGGSRMTNLSITRKPSTGGAAIRALYAFSYWSSRAGNDSFQIRMDAVTSGGRPYTSTINVSARVTD
jgi:hypothetical protein